ncbi:MAG TPA: acylphosphatase [Nitrososphaera sp.]|nr:acylphosphatase [Nitrososphaera sp.]
MNESKKIRAHIFVSGIVQGVYFRQNTKDVAKKNNVTGWVRNLPDGRVEAVLEGNEADVNKVIEWCHVGPPKAKVNGVNVKFDKYTGEFADFVISY